MASFILAGIACHCLTYCVVSVNPCSAVPQAEESVKGLGFPFVSIFRPGLLDRGSKARTGESLFSAIVSSVKVADVAKVMVADAEDAAAVGPTQGAAAAVRPAICLFEMKEIKLAAKEGRTPKPETPGC